VKGVIDTTESIGVANGTSELTTDEANIENCS